MAISKPTIVIAVAAWLTPACYEVFTDKLEASGFTTIVPPLPSIGGTKQPLSGLPEDVTVIKTILTKLADEGKEVILLSHSYGGVVASCAVEGLDVGSRAKAGLKGGVAKVVYMSAFMVPKGMSLVNMLGGKMLPWMSLEGDKVFAAKEHMLEVAFNDMTAEQAALGIAQMTYSAAIVFSAPSTYEPWSNGIPCAYIFCSIDNALPYPIQQQMSAQLGPEPETYTVKAGHCPYLSAPDELLEVVQKIAA